MAVASVERRLAAILAADVVGYSRLMGEDESGTLERLKAHRRELIQPKIAAHHGRMVKLMGDGALVEFASVVDAVQCAAEIQRALAEQELADSERVRVRMGLHAGEAIREEGDFFGRSVILAARIAAQAAGGEILVSEALKGLADGCEIPFDRRRELELKGLSGTHEVFSATWEAEAEPAHG